MFFSKCRWCGSSHSHRSHRHTLLDFLLLPVFFLVTPYRCLRCYRRFYVFGWFQKSGKK